jgi:hypothetical protein
MSEDINATGDAAELGAATIIRRNGGQVSFPFGDNAKYDIVADIGNTLYKVQVKSTTQRDGESGSLRAPLRSSDGYGYDDSDVDSFILYNQIDDEYYWLWPEECADTVARVCTRTRDEVHPPNRERATFSCDVMLSERVNVLQN